MREINTIIVHCTATPEGRPTTVSEVRKWHVKQNGWSDIGYHYLIYLDGSIHKGRPECYMGAHCAGHNTGSMGVCYVGGLAKDGKTPKDTRTPEQKAALRKLLTDLRRRFPKAVIRGHRDFAAKACPCFDAKSEYADI